jgi:hypothetical protein
MWVCMSIAIRNITLMLPPSEEGNINNIKIPIGFILYYVCKSCY